MAKTPELKIEYWPLKKLLAKRWERNPKLHDIDTLIASIVRYGFRDAVGYDATLKAVVEGHGRIEALERMKADGFSIPKGIRQSDSGDWLVPVSLGINAATQADAMAYATDHNNITMMGGDFTPQDTLRLWDQSLLSGLLSELRDSGALPVSADDAVVSELLASLNQNGNGDSNPDSGAQIDRAAELQKKWKTKPGQLWAIGRHKLLCGDSTKREDVERLMAGEKAVLMVTDPPYAVDYIAKAKDMNARGYGHSRATLGAAIAGDELSDEQCAEIWRASFTLALSLALVKNAAWYVWHAPGRAMTVLYNLFAEIGLLHHQTLIWTKNNFVIGRCDYQWKHEPCFYGWLKGNRPEFYGERNQTTVWQIDRDTQSPDHPTQKPVECFAIPMRNHARQDEIIYDPFAGSGTAIVAAEQHGCMAYCMDKSEKFVAVALERLSQMGLQPERIA